MRPSCRLAFLVAVLVGPALAQRPPTAQEYQVKAAFLYNFAKFVEWPAATFRNSQEPLVLGVLGLDPFGSHLDGINGKQVGGRQLIVRRYRSLRELGTCHILFISDSEDREVAQILKAKQSAPILTVSDIEGFAQRAGMIEFFIEDNKVRFKINIDAAQRAGLRVSSQLLRLAAVVRDKKRS